MWLKYSSYVSVHRFKNTVLFVCLCKPLNTITERTLNKSENNVDMNMNQEKAAHSLSLTNKDKTTSVEMLKTLRLNCIKVK